MADDMENLSERELEILYDTEFLQLKIAAVNKLWYLLDNTRYKLHEDIKIRQYAFPEKTDVANGKLSRGEYYQNLPYLILDFPKLMKQDSVLALRTMFWWGHEFSTTLHLQGYALESFRSRLIDQIDFIQNEGFYICINTTPWEYHFEENNYQKADELDREYIYQLLHEKAFVKISQKLPLKHWMRLPAFTLDYFHKYMELLGL